MHVIRWVSIERLVYIKYRPTTFSVQSSNRGCNSSQTSHCSVQTCAWCAELRNGIIHPLKGGCAKTMNCVGFTKLRILWNISHKTIKVVLLTGTILNYMDSCSGEKKKKSGFWAVIKLAGRVWVGWNVKWFPVSRITTPICTQKTISLHYWNGFPLRLQ